mmetsp:Transcript_57346/g.124080  ORF Transcript_57346/g.124080 Transcript_57346/m.124080 type:complete len:336 (-) Transcript_57346:40-1047(-)
MPVVIRVLCLLALLPYSGATGEPLQAEAQSIWDGIDVEDDGLLSARVPASLINLRVGEKKGIQLMGLQDTGTNLITAMMGLNFGNQLTLWDSSHSGATEGLWKHANPEALVRQVPDVAFPLIKGNVSIIAMVRDPLSWLQSVRKAPYELESCVVGDDWLNRSCTHPVPCGYGNEAEAETYDNLVSLWAHWTRSYGKLEDLGVQKVITLRYEDLVLYPEQVMTEIAWSMELKMPDKISLIDSPAKLHGEALGRDDALTKISEQKYLADFAEDSTKMVCGQLEAFQEILNWYSYDNCKEVGNFPRKVSFLRKASFRRKYNFMSMKMPYLDATGCLRR